MATTQHDTAAIRCAVCAGSAGPALMRVRDRRHGIAGEYDLVRCTGCGQVRTAPWPADLASAYPPGDYMNHTARTDPASRLFMRVMERTATQPRTRAARAALALVPAADLGGPLPAGARVLDVGCGTGHAVAAMRAAGLDAHGIEPDPESVRIANEAGLDTVTLGTLDEDGPAAGQRWDVVRFWHTLEHTPTPLQALARARQALVPGGRVVVGVPNFGGAGRRVFRGRWDGLEIPRHLHHFERASLTGLLQRAGLVVDRARTVAILGVTAGSLDGATRRGTTQRSGPLWSALQLAAHPLELGLGAVGAGDALLVHAHRPRED